MNFDLMSRGWTLNDIGGRLSWTDIRDFIKWVPPTADSALFREANPKSWWWTLDADFLAAILYGLQVANWQRGGGKGTKPKVVTRPVDVKPGRNMPKDSDELAIRRRRLREAQQASREKVSGGD